MNSKKPFVCFTLELTGYLCQKGFQLIRTAPSTKNPDTLVYFFEDTLPLRIAVREYQTAKQQERCKQNENTSAAARETRHKISKPN